MRSDAAVGQRVDASGSKWSEQQLRSRVQWPVAHQAVELAAGLAAERAVEPAVEFADERAAGQAVELAAEQAAEHAADHVFDYQRAAAGDQLQESFGEVAVE